MQNLCDIIMSASIFTWPQKMTWNAKCDKLTHGWKTIKCSEEKQQDKNKVNAKTDAGNDSKDAKPVDIDAYDNKASDAPAATLKNKIKKVFNDLGAGKG